MRVWGTLAGAAAIALVATVALRPNERSSPPVAVFAPPVCDIWAKSGRDEIGYWGENERGMKFRYIPAGRLTIDASNSRSTLWCRYKAWYRRSNVGFRLARTPSLLPPKTEASR